VKRAGLNLSLESAKVELPGGIESGAQNSRGPDLLAQAPGREPSNLED
jgi:hypothetical protein